MMSGLGDEIDPAMMSALMATTALVAAGASNEEVRRESLAMNMLQMVFCKTSGQFKYFKC